MRYWCPGVSNLDVRRRELSEKAKDNEEQKNGTQEQEAINEILNLEEQIVERVEEVSSLAFCVLAQARLQCACDSS